MTYNLDFHPDALAEWQALDGSVKKQLKKKLAERLAAPRVPAAQVSGAPDLYKIKLRALGFRLVYHVNDSTVTVLVLSVGKQDKSAAYTAALARTVHARA